MRVRLSMRVFGSAPGRDREQLVLAAVGVVHHHVADLGLIRRSRRPRRPGDGRPTSASFQSTTRRRIALRRASTEARRAPSSRSSAPSTVASASIGLTAVTRSPSSMRSRPISVSRRTGLSRSSRLVLELLGELGDERAGAGQGGAVDGDLYRPKLVQIAHIAIRRKSVRQVPATSRVCHTGPEIES